MLGIVGCVFLLISIFLGYFYYINQSEPFVQFSDMNTKTNSFVLPFGVIMLLFISLWFVLEYGQYKYKKTSLVKDILHEHFTPILSILIGSFFLAVLMETQNLLYYFWIYINVPFEDITFLGFPILMFFGWPLHYIIFLSLWRLFTDEQSQEVWKGDLIK